MPVSDILIAVIMILIMFSIGLAMKPKNLKAIFEERKSLLIGLFFQIVFLPVFTFLLLSFSNLPPVFKAGFFIVAICPGGTMSNFITYLLKGDIALSFLLTTVNTIIILFTVPFLTQFAVSHYMEHNLFQNIDLSMYILKVILGLLIPVFIGFIFKYSFPRVSFKIQQPLKIINSVLLALVFTLKIFGSEKSGGSGISFNEILMLLPLALIIHLGAILISYFLSLKLNIKNIKASTIGIEVGLQNTTLALLITSTILHNNDMSKPAIVFAMFTFFTTLIFGYLSLNFKR
ncbi:MAG: bile acid:sodium symporter [Chitinophagales bacterium]|nr:bile acid:sodium symporter [Chitinophagales bacterium]